MPSPVDYDDPYCDRRAAAQRRCLLERGKTTSAGRRSARSPNRRAERIVPAPITGQSSTARRGLPMELPRCSCAPNDSSSAPPWPASGGANHRRRWPRPAPMPRSRAVASSWASASTTRRRPPCAGCPTTARSPPCAPTCGASPRRPTGPRRSSWRRCSPACWRWRLATLTYLMPPAHTARARAALGTRWVCVEQAVVLETDPVRTIRLRLLLPGPQAPHGPCSAPGIASPCCTGGVIYLASLEA